MGCFCVRACRRRGPPGAEGRDCISFEARRVSVLPGEAADRSGASTETPQSRNGLESLRRGQSCGLSWTLPDGNASNCHPDGSGRGTDNTLPVENASGRDVDTSDRRPDAPDFDADVV